MNTSFFGKNVKRLRTELNLSQKEFGKRLNTCQQYISKLEHNHIEPTVNFMFAIIREFNITVEELLDGIED